MRITPIALLLAILSIVACTRHPSPPPRPNGVPADALWAGGADGGSFVKCFYDSGTALNTCAVYNDYTGQLETQGKFKITGQTRAQDAERFAYSGFDGKKIYLKDGSVLTPTSDAAQSPK